MLTDRGRVLAPPDAQQRLDDRIMVIPSNAGILRRYAVSGCLNGPAIMISEGIARAERT